MRDFLLEYSEYSDTDYSPNVNYSWVNQIANELGEEIKGYNGSGTFGSRFCS